MTTNIIIRDLEALKQAVFDLTGYPVNVVNVKSKNRDFGIGERRCVERFHKSYSLLQTHPALLLRALPFPGQYSLVAAYLPQVVAHKHLREMLEIPVQKTAPRDGIWASSHRIADKKDALRPADYFSVTYGITKMGNESKRTRRFSGRLKSASVLKDIQALFEFVFPDQCKRQLAAAEDMPQGPFKGTSFTSVAMNESSIQYGQRKFGGTAVHQDTDAMGSLQASVMLENTATNAGYLLFPDYKVAVNQKAGDVVFMNPYEWHGTDGNIDFLTMQHRRVPAIFFMTGIKAVKFKSNMARVEAALM